MKQRASILLVNRTYPPMRGATGRLLHDLARHLVKSGMDVSILTTTTGKPSQNKRGPVTITRIAGTDRPGMFGYLRGLYKLYCAMLRQKPHDIILTMSDPPMLYAAGHYAARAKNSLHIHWCQDLYPDLLPVLDFPIPASIIRRARDWGRGLLNQASCVIAISRCMQRHMAATGIDTRRTAVIENWPDQELVAPVAESAFSAGAAMPHASALRDRRLYSDPAGQKFRVLYAGSIGRAHPVDAVIHAARILQKSQPDIEMVFVGTGPGFDRLAQARAQAGLENIRLMPPQPRGALRALMESGDVHLVTMRDEALGMLLPSKLYSGLAVGRPTVFVGPSECDVARILARYNCGRVVRPGDGKALAAAITLYRTDSEAWFAAHEGAATAMKARLPIEAFTLWSNVIKKVLHARHLARHNP